MIVSDDLISLAQAYVVLASLYHLHELLRYLFNMMVVQCQKFIEHRKQLTLHKGFYKKPRLDSKNNNVLFLFHGRAGTPYGRFLLRVIDYVQQYVYTLDRDPHIKPDILGDVLKGALTSLPASSFDRILIPMCWCCTREIAIYQGLQFLTELVALLKPKGTLYISGHNVLFKTAKISVTQLNDLGLRGLGYTTLGECVMGDSLVLIKDATLPPLMVEEQKIPVPYCATH